MKIGIRKPNISKSLSARNPMTQVKRKYSTKKYTDPIGTMKKRTYNKVYNKTTVSVKDLGKSSSHKPSKLNSYKPSKNSLTHNYTYNYDDNYTYSYDDDYTYSNYDYENFTEKQEREYKETKERINKEAKNTAIIFYLTLLICILIVVIPFIKFYCWLFY